MMESWAGMGSALASLVFLWTMLRPYIPPELTSLLRSLAHKLLARFDPYLSLSIPEFDGERLKRSEAFDLVKAYLSSSCSRRSRRLRAELRKGGDRFLLSMGDHQDLTDHFSGAPIYWSSVSRSPPPSSLPPWYGATTAAERRSYRIKFHERHRDLVLDHYLPHVLREGRAAAARSRQRKLYTNIESTDWDSYRKSMWSDVPFEHPSTFGTLAMDPARKQEIIDDLTTFRNGRDYYTKIGKPWKRGYLLHGPPGTGKSTMIAAMANFLDYDVYDLELTAVKSNTTLRKLFIQTTSKSIIVIEDIDCSLDLTGKREKKKKKKSTDSEESKKSMEPPKKEEKDEQSKVTLSGLLNFIDGLWSACGGERLIVFTTNHIERLDPALIRRGRMDKHIEMSYCCFEAFKILAKNYLDIESHPLYDTIKELVSEVKITPADVAENLMPKADGDGPEACLESLVQALNKAKEEAAMKEHGSKEEETGDEDSD